MISTIGEISLVVAFVVALGTSLVSMAAGANGSDKLLRISRQGIYLFGAAILVSSATLVHAFLSHDFSIEYVQQYSDVRMPMLYLLAAFWGGQAGSLLFWALIVGIFSAAVAHFSKDRTPELMAWVHAVVMVVATFMLLLLVFISNPFQTFFLRDIPLDGSGLNPLLQNYWMALHPPSLLIGFASFVIPFAFGVAALMTGRTEPGWIREMRVWLLISWLFLTLGNFLGARWAYEELGWGGYWAWDPVENAGILPWFTATALLHSVMIEERRGLLRRWNMILLILTFWLTFFGTFLTRSGMISSVHSFAASPIGPALLVFVFVIAGFGLVLLAARWRLLRPRGRLGSYFSRESMFVLNNWLFLAAAFVVFWGTLFPKLKELVGGTESSVGPPWFNGFAIPIGLILLLVMTLGTILAWRRMTVANARRNILPPLLVTLALTPLLCLLYAFTRLRALRPTVDEFGYAVAIGFTAMTVLGLTVVVIEFYRGTKARKAKTGGDTLSSLLTLIGKNRRRYGGYLVHVGILLMFFGFSGNIFKVEQQVTLEMGQSTHLGDYLITYQGMEVREDSDKLVFLAILTLQRCAWGETSLDTSNCSEPQTISPARFDYSRQDRSGPGDPGMITSEIGTSTNLIEDVYVALSGFNQDGAAASFEMYVNPFVSWVWFGGVFMIIAVVICLWPDRSKRKKVTNSRNSLRAMGKATFAALVLLTSLELFGSGEAMAQGDLPPPGSTPEGMVEPVRRDGSANAELYSMIRCECSGCSGQTIDNCKPTCGVGARDRERIDQMLADGSNRDEILAYFVAERGELALAIPSGSVMVWVIPIGSVVFGLLLVWIVIYSMKKREVTSESSEPAIDGETSEYQERLALELKELD